MFLLTKKLKKTSSGCSGELLRYWLIKVLVVLRMLIWEGCIGQCSAILALRQDNNPSPFPLHIQWTEILNPSCAVMVRDMTRGPSPQRFPCPSSQRHAELRQNDKCSHWDALPQVPAGLPRVSDLKGLRSEAMQQEGIHWWNKHTSANPINVCWRLNANTTLSCYTAAAVVLHSNFMSFLHSERWREFSESLCDTNKIVVKDKEHRDSC